MEKGTRKALQPLPVMQEANSSWYTMQECVVPPRVPSHTPTVKYCLGNKKQVFYFILFVIITASPDHKNYKWYQGIHEAMVLTDC